MLKKTCFMLLFYFFTISTFVSIASSADSDWPMFLNDSRHTGRSPYTIGNQVELLWESEFSKTRAYDFGIAVGLDGTIYTGSDDHYLYALNPADGSVKWEYQTDHEIVGTPAIDSNGTIYTGTRGGHVYSIDPDGTLNWDYDVVGRVTGSIVISSTNQIVVPTNERIFSFDAVGNSLWEETFPFPVLPVDGLPYASNSSPAIGDDGTVYVCGFGKPGVSAGLISLEPNGDFVWHTEILGAGFSSPAIADDGTIYCPGGHSADGGDYDLAAVNPDGTVAWIYNLPDMPYLANTSVGHDGTIFIGTDDYFLNAVNPDGTLKWRYLTTSTMNASSSIIGANGVVLTVPLHGGQDLFAINSDGTLRWRLEGGFLQNPVIADGILYIGYSNGVRAYDISDLSSPDNMTGTWSFSTTNNWASAGCTPDADDTGELTMTQTGDNVTAIVAGEGITFTGTIIDNQLVTTTSFPEDGGTTTMGFDVTVSSALTSASGTLTWNWVNGNVSCNGGSDISCNKTNDIQNSGSGGGGGGGGGGIFGDIIKSSVIGYHLDGFTAKGVQVYMPVTPGFKALKGAQEYVRSFAPNLAEFVREFFDFFEQKADANKEGFLYNTGTHAFPLLGKIAEESLELIGEEKFIDSAYSDTTISIEEFEKLKKRGLAVAPKVIKDGSTLIDNPRRERIITDLVY